MTMHGAVVLLLTFSLFAGDVIGDEVAAGGDLPMPDGSNATGEVFSTGKTTDDMKSSSEKNISGANNLTVGHEKREMYPVEKVGNGTELHLPQNVHMEECDVVNRCIDEKNKLIVCLTVPGNDSPMSSILVQNKGTVALTVTITVPDFVHVKHGSVSVQAKENRKVNISFENGVSNNTILVTAANWHCNLSFWDMIPNSIVKKGSPVTMEPKISKDVSFIFMPLVALFFLCVVFLLIRYKRKYALEKQDYQILESSLPVSSGGMKQIDSMDGWDSNWGEDWDDEEAPVTPSNPSLNLSSKGLASRRSNKEGWKD